MLEGRGTKNKPNNLMNAEQDVFVFVCVCVGDAKQGFLSSHITI